MIWEVRGTCKKIRRCCPASSPRPIAFRLCRYFAGTVQEALGKGRTRCRRKSIIPKQSDVVSKTCRCSPPCFTRRRSQVRVLSRPPSVFSVTYDVRSVPHPAYGRGPFSIRQPELPPCRNFIKQVERVIQERRSHRGACGRTRQFYCFPMIPGSQWTALSWKILTRTGPGSARPR